jgi:Tfp pilus assembly protein PilP
MRIAIVLLALALSACASNPGIKNWKQTARANCEKEADPIQRQTCRERVEAVSTAQPRPEDGKKR